MESLRAVYIYRKRGLKPYRFEPVTAYLTNLHPSSNVMDKNQKVVLGFILGVAAGAVAGILLAPESGEETRRKISDKAKNYKDDLSGQINSAISKLSAYVEKVQGELKGVAAEATEKAKANVN